MAEHADMEFPYSGIDDMPRALRNGAVVTPEGKACRVNMARDTMLQLARRIENGGIHFVVVEVEKPVSGLKALLDALVYTFAIWCWVYRILPTMVHVVLGWLS